MCILFYGNCQTNALSKLLTIKKHKIYQIECHSTEIDELEFKNIINECDIIITQEINNNYRNKHYLSTQYIINNCKPDTIIIIFDSCYFNFYYFDLDYVKINNQKLDKPIDYHYNKMIECYKLKLSYLYYIDNYVNNINLFSSEQLEEIANNCLDELYKRYFITINKYKNNSNIYIISTYQYISDNYKNKLLFYSMNHPSKYLLQYICEEILKILNLFKPIDYKINYDIDPLYNPKCIIYRCIQKVVNFNIDDYKPLLDNKNNVNEISKYYYDTYQNIKF
jgi:hypothetical protein